MAKRAVVPCEGPRRLKESTCRKLGIRGVSHQEEGRWKEATKREEGSHYVATKLGCATFYSRPSGNHDRPVPVQCSTIVNSGLKSVTSCVGNQKSIVQIHFFEYEMIRGLQVFSDRKNKF